MKNSNEIDKFDKEYRKKHPTYKEFASRLKDLLTSLLKTENYHLIECRAKTPESFCEKITRKNNKYKNPLDEITDKIGLRVIVYYPKDVEKVVNVIRENFRIDEPNSFNAKDKLDDNSFGYLSTHLVVTINNDRKKLPEWKEYTDLKAEIQIRTVLQHAWAAISHELEYKKDHDIPSIMKRPLYRMASLIELADEEFERINIEHGKVRKAIANKEKIDDIEIYEEINLDSLKNFIETNIVIKEINEKAKNAGFKLKDITNQHLTYYYPHTISLINILKIKTISDLEQTTKSQIQTIQKFYEEIISTNDTKWTTSSLFNLELLLISILNKKQLKLYEKNISHRWDETIWFNVKEIVLNRMK